MSMGDCSAGSQWDTLVKACVRTGPVNKATESRPEAATSEVFQVAEVRPRSTARTPRVDPGIALSPALWLFVVLTTLGSILALALWFIIYRQQRRSSSTPEHSKPEQEQKTDARLVIHSLPSEGDRHADLLHRGADDPSLCPFHLHLEAHSSSQWVEDVSLYREPAKHAGMGKLRGPPSCTPVREHRIPLPATELGGTALVTTKTV